MYKKIFTAFISGASWPAFVLFFNGFHSYVDTGILKPNKCINNLSYMNPYYLYTIVAPFYLGIMSAIAVGLHLSLKWSLSFSFALISIISAILISIIITICDIYNFTTERLHRQYLYLIIYHFIIYNLIIANIYRTIVS